MNHARRTVLVIAALLSSARAHADNPDSTTAAAHDLEQRITSEASSARRTRLVTGGVVLALGGIATGVAAFDALTDSLRPTDSNVTVHKDNFGYVLLGGGLLSIATGIFALAVDTPQEHVYDATRHATPAEERQAVAVEAHANEHRRSIMRGVGIGFLAASAGALVAYFAAGDRFSNTTAETIALSGAGAGTVGLLLTLSSFARSPIERMNDDLPDVEMMRASSQTLPPRVSAGVMPTRGGAIVGFNAAF